MSCGISVDDVFHNVEWNVKERRRQTHHQFVSDFRDFQAVRTEISIAPLNFVDERFRTDEYMVTRLQPLARITEDVSDKNPKQCQECIIPDLDLTSFALQYREMENSPNIESMITSQILKHVLKSGIAMPELSVSLVRI